MILLSPADFLSNYFFFKDFFSGTQSERQTVWIQIRTTFFLSESGSKQFAKSRLARKGGKPA